MVLQAIGLCTVRYHDLRGFKIFPSVFYSILKNGYTGFYGPDSPVKEENRQIERIYGYASYVRQPDAVAGILGT